MLFDIVQLVEFAINDSVSPLSHRPPGDRLHTLLRRQVLGPPTPTVPLRSTRPSGVRRGGCVPDQARVLKCGRVCRSGRSSRTIQGDMPFTVGDKGKLVTEHTSLSSRSLLSPHWMGPS